MARRLPGIRQRLEDVALDLYEQQGVAATTARQIADAAGTTERTFFRHFRDKVDAAFGDEGRLLELARDAIAVTPASQGAWTAVHAGLRSISAEFMTRRDAVLRRNRVVAAEPALHEREMGRGSDWVDAFASTLRDRGTSAPEATVCATAALALFRVSLARWADDPESALPEHLDNTFGELSRIAGSAELP